MLPQKLKHLERARQLLASGDPESLRYCCLELRVCIELIAYERLDIFEKELPLGFEKWQPREVVDALVDCDPDADKDFTMRVGLEGPAGEPPTRMMTVGTYHALTRQFVQRRYHKLGSYLHAPTYAQVKAHTEPVPDKQFLEETLREVERLCSSTVASNFGSKVTLVCQDCGTTIVRNTAALKRDGRLTCLEPSCKAVYGVEGLDTPAPLFRMERVDFACACGATVFVGRHRLRDGLRISCHGCHRTIAVSRPWYFVLEDTASTPGSPEAEATTPPTGGSPTRS